MYLHQSYYNSGIIKSMLNIFQATENWSFSQKQKLAEAKLADIQNQTIAALPPEMFSEKSITLFDQIRTYKLYSLLKTLPKGTMQHLHFDCCEDQDFYAQHIIPDPIVYLTKNMDAFGIGTKEEAEKNEWISMGDARKSFNSDDEFVKKVSNLTMLSKEDMLEFSSEQGQRWAKFEKKIQNFFPLIGAQHILKNYTIYALRKYIKNGYDRIEFRSFLGKVNEYDEQGNLVKVHPEKKFMEIIDEAIQIVQKEHPILTVDFIFFGLKVLPPQVNEEILTNVLQLRWPRTIGIDFVQQEDPYGDQKPYDDVANKVLAKFPDLDIKKVYHVGETKNHKNKNIQVAINAGTARIGHGINVFQHPHLLNICREKKICFEKCPISNLLLTYCKDPRQGTSPLVQGLGIPITINPDDPGKFGYQDSTMDYFFAFVSYNWTLQNLKLLSIHSINHAICSSETKKNILESFNGRWQKWIDEFLGQ